MMLPYLIDTHAHLTSSHCLQDADAMVAAAQEANVKAILNVCTDRPSLECGLRLAATHPSIYNAAAVHPEEVALLGMETFTYFAQQARAGALVAVGETGLDYYHTSPRDLQHLFMRQHLELALELDLPLIFHCREAFEDLFVIADQMQAPLRAVIHCFTGSYKDAQSALERGWYLSFGGIVTYKKNDDLRAIVKQIPLDRLLIETDTPFLAPQSKRGKSNQPSYIVETAQRLADLHQLTLTQFATITTANAHSLFGIR